jgi:hypothetical protein
MTLTSRTPIVSIAALLAAITLTGCLRIHDPDSTPPRTARTTTVTAPVQTTVADADPAPERGGTIPAAAHTSQTRLAANAGQGTPTAALERYGSWWANWTAATLIARQQQLATISLGQARAQALQAAASFHNDRTLAASHVANRGRVIAISPSLTARGEWVVVTSETTTGQGDYAGLPATLHVTYAQLTHTRQGFVVSQWSPQN